MAAAVGGDSICLWEATTGKPLNQIRAAANNTGKAIAFSPNGKALAWGGRDNTVHLWELATEKERVAFQGHDAAITYLSFSPGGRALASGSMDTTVVVWDVTGRMKDGRLEAVQLTLKELEAHWANLAGDNAATAYRSMWTLVAAGKDTMPFLEAKLRPPGPVPDAKRVSRLIMELDDKSFAVREKATKELEHFGPAVNPALKQALAGNPSAEARGRLRALLVRLGDPAHKSNHLLRASRTIELLEAIGTPAAQQTLEMLVKNGAEASLQLEAKESLQRLGRRKATPQ